MASIDYPPEVHDLVMPMAAKVEGHRLSDTGEPAVIMFLKLDTGDVGVVFSDDMADILAEELQQIAQGVRDTRPPYGQG